VSYCYIVCGEKMIGGFNFPNVPTVGSRIYISYVASIHADTDWTPEHRAHMKKWDGAEVVVKEVRYAVQDGLNREATVTLYTKEHGA
jgi:hypothetical protein